MRIADNGRYAEDPQTAETPERAARIVERGRTVNAVPHENALPHRRTAIAAGSDRIACYGSAMAAPSSPRSARALTRLLVPVLLATTLLAGCNNDRGRYPSLARRPAERSFAVPPAPASAPDAPQAPDDGTLLARADALVAAAQEADKRFAASAATAAPRITAGRGAARGSDPWARAQIALAELESARSRATIALADFDRLLVETTIADPQGADPRLPAVRRQHEAVGAIVAGEDARIAELQAALPE